MGASDHCLSLAFPRPSGSPTFAQEEGCGLGLTPLPLPFQGSAPILVAMVILLNIGVAILFINFFI